MDELEPYARGLFMHGRPTPFLRNLLFFLGLGLSLLITFGFLGIAAFAWSASGIAGMREIAPESRDIPVIQTSNSLVFGTLSIF